MSGSFTAVSAVSAAFSTEKQFQEKFFVKVF